MSSSLSLYHYDVVSKLSFNRRVSIGRSVRGAGFQSESCFLEWPHHRPPSHPTKVSLWAWGGGYSDN